ncbi:MAG: hypothetical protein B7Y95_13770 [Rhizobiales bacterium 32-66-11]|nr:MAG: hypothetical protein B7Y95_13770 [Rhizobiales bacterium 32-66-11]
MILTPAPVSIAADSTHISLPGRPLDLPTEQSLHILHDLSNGQRLHLAFPVDGSPGRPLVAVIPLGIEGFDRMEAVARLLASLHGRAIPPDTRLTRQQLARARRMLQAVDGHRAGASQREIAKVIFRLKSVRRDDWQSAPERYATTDLIKDGLAMIAGGYRKLLRHRRRP